MIVTTKVDRMLLGITKIGFAHHDVPSVGRGLGDQCNMAPTSASQRCVAAHIRADPFGARARLAETAAGKDQPSGPIADCKLLADLAALDFDWKFWSRPEQLAPTGGVALCPRKLI
jgi:hypothetical protein